MIPILYQSGETVFESNGLGRIPCVKCIVTEQRNGKYEVEFSVSISEKIYPEIQEGLIIACIHDDRKDVQPFDIYARTAPINGIVTFYARHISYRLDRIILKPFTAGTVAEAFAKIPGKSANDNPFTFWTDKTATGSFAVDYPKSVRNALGGSAGSILDVFGKGEFQWDKWTVRLYLNRGQDSGVQIRYGKNLSDIVHQVDYSGSFTAVAPYWIDGNTGQVLSLPEVIVSTGDSARPEDVITHNGDVITDDTGDAIEMAFFALDPVALDLSDTYDTQPSIEQLRSAGTAYLQQAQPWEPEENTKVDFVALWQTEEYANIAQLQRVSLCDKVSVFYPELGVNAIKQQVIEVRYDVLAERYTRMELGKPKATLSDLIKADVSEAVLQKVPTKSMMEQAIDSATKLILGGAGSHAVWGVNADGQPNELFFMDTTDPETAVNVLRINGNGIGFSTTGINGPFSTAWTIDGSFVASFITTGILNANLLKTGIISDLQGRNYWNLETGEISISFDPGEGGDVTQADLQRVENNARNWAAAAEAAAKGYTDTALEGALDGYATEEQVTGEIDASIAGLRTEFAGTYAMKGDTVSQTVTYYYQSTSPTQLFGGSWSTDAPDWTNGLYIWEKHRYIKADNTYTEDNPVCVTGNTGAQGIDGEDAVYLYITSNASTSVAKGSTAQALLTACVGKGDEADIDPYGTIYRYGWFKAEDNSPETYLITGKTLAIIINEYFCEDRASVRFALVTAEDLQLSDNTGDPIETDTGDIIEVA